MRVPDDPRRAPRELLSLRSATTTYLGMLRDADSYAEQAADVNRLVVPEYAALLDQLRDEIRAASNDHESGTPGRIAVVVGELLGERP